MGDKEDILSISFTLDTILEWEGGKKEIAKQPQRGTGLINNLRYAIISTVGVGM